jgi:hydroxyacylglutathione hydrolase
MKVHPIPAFTDNYIWCIEKNSNCVVVDPGEAKPVLDYLQEKGLELTGILVTHHHHDHMGGVDELLARFPVPVYASASGSYTFAHQPCAQGDRVALDSVGCEFRVLEIPGHTLDHIAYVGEGAVYCGDTLFAGGCGRIFEGTAEMMHASLQKLAALPAETQVYCGHEYTEANLAFAQTVDVNNAALKNRIAIETEKRQRHEPTLPSNIGLELETNPFLRGDSSDLAPDFLDREPVAVFRHVRELKDGF